MGFPRGLGLQLHTEKKRRAVGIILRLYWAGLNFKRTGVGIVSIAIDIVDKCNKYPQSNIVDLTSN